MCLSTIVDMQSNVVTLLLAPGVCACVSLVRIYSLLLPKICKIIKLNELHLSFNESHLWMALDRVPYIRTLTFNIFMYLNPYPRWFIILTTKPNEKHTMDLNKFGMFDAYDLVNIIAEDMGLLSCHPFVLRFRCTNSGKILPVETDNGVLKVCVCD